jgi:hypothetical protein
MDGASAASAEMLGWLAKLAYVLVSSRPDASAEEVASSLPTVQELTQCAMTCVILPTHSLTVPYLYRASEQGQGQGLVTK